MSVKLLDANGPILHSKGIAIDRAGNQTEEVSIDGSLDGLAMTIGNEGWENAKDQVHLTYTRSPTVYSLASIASASIGISGAVITSFSVLQYLIYKTKRKDAEQRSSMDMLNDRSIDRSRKRKS